MTGNSIKEPNSESELQRKSYSFSPFKISSRQKLQVFSRSVGILLKIQPSRIRPWLLLDVNACRHKDVCFKDGCKFKQSNNAADASVTYTILYTCTEYIGIVDVYDVIYSVSALWTRQAGTMLRSRVLLRTFRLHCWQRGVSRM